MIFALDQPADLLLRMKAAPFLIAGKVQRQLVNVKLNDQLLDALILDEAREYDFSISLPAGGLRQRNILSFRLPNASSPRVLRVGYDSRHLGLAVRSLEIVSGPAGIR